MHTGTVGLRPTLTDEQQDRPVGLCPGCQGEVWPGEMMTKWEGKWLCPDCFEWQVSAWLRSCPGQAARALGLDRREAGEEG